MKIFLFKAACFIFGFWFISYSLANLADKWAPMNVYGKGEAESIKTLLDHKDSIQAIALGNSHCEAIDFDTLGLPGQRLVRAGTDLFEIKLYAGSVVPKLPNLGTTFISLSYFSFARKNILLDDSRNLRIELYGILPSWKPLPGDTDSLILGKLHQSVRIMSVIRPDHWQDVFTNALGNITPTEDIPPWSKKTMTPWGECSHFTQSELDSIGYEIGYKAANSHLEYMRLDPTIPDQSYQALADTIEMLQSRGIRVVLFTPPYSDSYNARFYEVAPEMIESMYRAVESLQNKYGVEYYDAASLAEFSAHPELFYNSDHLNDCGRRAFSEYLKKEMDRR